ncbi:MAG: hypothetical protein HQL15_05445 [Candidatus Omnitrophica bacterium]|nr:hypothetical protein [Candidatus Omnitrophota bacterium]
MWWKWFPWRFLVKDAARSQGFLDPIKLLSQLQNFAQPSEVAAPTELIRSGVVLHARGLINSLAIQHNLDWVWPYWVECQYDPNNDAFIPRSFSLTQINLTHRNWTALGVPGGSEFPLVDPRGLLTPFYDSWSIDVWIIPKKGYPLIPSRLPEVQTSILTISQKMHIHDNFCVTTQSGLDQCKLELNACVIGSAKDPVCQLKVTAEVFVEAQLVIALRPYNPEGVSFVHKITLLEDALGWQVNDEHLIFLDKPADQWVFSDYHRGDVYSSVSASSRGAGGPKPLPCDEEAIVCKVGMATAAAVYHLEAGQTQEVIISAPLSKKIFKNESLKENQDVAQLAWNKSLQGSCQLQIPDKHFQFLYEAAIHTMILHSPKEVYPGPFIYRRFWFRDAAFILYALLCVGLKARVRGALDCFRARQTAQGYFLSQEGEWDSNGEALWNMRQYCEMTGSLPPDEWKESIYKAGKWICKKRLSAKEDSPHAGLLPSGFSAEHLGPNDFYYWDDFWGVAGLSASAYLSAAYNDEGQAAYFKTKSQVLLGYINQSLKKVEGRLGRLAMPASPYRRMDTGAIGSLVASYPLRVLQQDDARVLDTANYLMQNCLVHGGFFHDMTHSGINPYLTLHLAQVYLRAGDSRYLGLMSAVAQLASPTGQWPESVHPRTGGGCMGDGQHVWAAAEWVLMIRNCFVREEEEGLILCSGIPPSWLKTKEPMIFGPAPTRFGDIHISMTFLGEMIQIEWQGQWFTQEPVIDIQLPGFKKVRVLAGVNCLALKEEAQS